MEEVWKNLKTHIKETLKLNIWNESDLCIGMEELNILREWDILNLLNYIGPWRNK
jgi:hypothetical protein